MWYGQYSHSLDEKDRFILPAKFREKLASLKKKKLYITRGLDGCLSIFTDEVWRKREEKLNALPFTRRESRSFNRIFFSGASEVEIDAQGRISIPENLQKYAGIAQDSPKREIIIIGVGESIEVWSKKTWENFYEERRGRFEEAAEDLFE